MPGSYNGTLADRLSETLNIGHVSVGSVVRDKKDSQRMNSKLFNNPRFVYDTVVRQALAEGRRVKPCFRHGVVIDDSPRAKNSIDELNKVIESMGFSLSAIINIKVPVIIGMEIFTSVQKAALGLKTQTLHLEGLLCL
ncbi:nucleoside monophosphate kinase [Candidatus Omnitrophota bacterium]